MWQKPSDVSSQSQTDCETTQQAPRYSSDSMEYIYMPCNARLVTVTPESAVCIYAFGALLV